MLSPRKGRSMCAGGRCPSGGQLSTPRAGCTFSRNAYRPPLSFSYRAECRSATLAGADAGGDGALGIRSSPSSMLSSGSAVRGRGNADFAIERGESFRCSGRRLAARTTTLRRSPGSSSPPTADPARRPGRGSRVPPYSPHVNTVFQHYALFPHMTVADNVGRSAPREPRRWAAEETARRVEQLLSVVRLTQYAAGSRRSSRRASSSAWRWRARWSTIERLLLDEPLGAARSEAPAGRCSSSSAHPAGGRHHVHLRDARPGRGA